MAERKVKAAHFSVPQFTTRDYSSFFLAGEVTHYTLLRTIK
jgi:hypothetical protein